MHHNNVYIRTENGAGDLLDAYNCVQDVYMYVITYAGYMHSNTCSARTTRPAMMCFYSLFARQRQKNLWETSRLKKTELLSVAVATRMFFFFLRFKGRARGTRHVRKRRR